MRSFGAGTVNDTPFTKLRSKTGSGVVNGKFFTRMSPLGPGTVNDNPFTRIRFAERGASPPDSEGKLMYRRKIGWTIIIKTELTVADDQLRKELSTQPTT